MMENFKVVVSVILPTYNRAHLLGRAVRSVLAQTYRDFELIIVDDGSTDGTVALANSWDDPRIRLIQHPANRGGGAARNTGIRAARGTYVAFQDSDDEWLPSKLAEQVAALTKAEASTAAVYCAYWWNDGKTCIKRPQPEFHTRRQDGAIFEDLLRFSFITTQAVMIKREQLLESGGFDERLPRLQDWELFIRLTRCYRFKYIERPLLSVYYQDDSITADDPALVTALRIILDKHSELLDARPKVKSRHVYWLGSNLLRLGKVSEARECLRESIRLDPTFVRGLVRYILSFCSIMLYRNFERIIKRC